MAEFLVNVETMDASNVHSLLYALAHAVSGDVIKINPPEYNSSFDCVSSYVVPSGVTIQKDDNATTAVYLNSTSASKSFLTFAGDVTFKGITFGAYSTAYIGAINTVGTTVFEDCNFGSSNLSTPGVDAEFLRVNIASNTVFRNCIFSRIAYYTSAHTSTITSAIITHTSGTADFENCRFFGCCAIDTFAAALIDQATTAGKLTLSGCKIENVNGAKTNQTTYAILRLNGNALLDHVLVQNTTNLTNCCSPLVLVGNASASVELRHVCDKFRACNYSVIISAGSLTCVNCTFSSVKNYAFYTSGGSITLKNTLYKSSTGSVTPTATNSLNTNGIESTTFKKSVQDWSSLENLAPLATSQAIDGSDLTFLLPTDTVDVLGNPRVLDGTADIGSIETLKRRIVVKNLNDSGFESLRYCILSANKDDRITFDPTLKDGVITLLSRVTPEVRVIVDGSCGTASVERGITIDGGETYDEQGNPTGTSFALIEDQKGSSYENLKFRRCYYRTITNKLGSFVNCEFEDCGSPESTNLEAAEVGVAFRCDFTKNLSARQGGLIANNIVDCSFEGLNTGHIKVFTGTFLRNVKAKNCVSSGVFCSIGSSGTSYIYNVSLENCTGSTHLIYFGPTVFISGLSVKNCAAQRLFYKNKTNNESKLSILDGIYARGNTFSDDSILGVYYIMRNCDLDSSFVFRKGFMASGCTLSAITLNEETDGAEPIFYNSLYREVSKTTASYADPQFVNSIQYNTSDASSQYHVSKVFIDYANGDRHLNKVSPAALYGTVTAYDESVDFDGKTRDLGMGVTSSGAYVYVQTSQSQFAPAFGDLLIPGCISVDAGADIQGEF